MWVTLIWLLTALLFVYPFVMYPWILTFWAARYRRRVTGAVEPSELPSIAMVICALNEERVIGSKLENCLQLNYPKHRLRIILVSDGSTDGTVDIARWYTTQGIQLIEQPIRRGKIANLNEVVPALQEEIVVLSDANVFYHPDSLLRLVARFEDPSIGGVSGKVILTNNIDSLDTATKEYYSIEWRLQQDASAIYSMAGADGAMYAFRRTLFQPCPNDTVIEDFVIPMGIVRQGKRVVFEENAIGWENGATSLQEEFRRKVRIAAGAVQGLCRGNAWPAQAPLRFWFIFISHKLLRWFSPLAGIVLLGLAGFLPAPLSAVVMAGFGGILSLAALRIVLRSRSPIFDAPFYFLFAQFAVTLGLLKGLTGGQSVLWAKVNR